MTVTRLATQSTVLGAALAIGFLIAPVQAAPVYHLTICGVNDPGGPGSPCYVKQANTTPTPEHLAGLTGDAMKQYLLDHGVTEVDGREYDIILDIRGATASGYVYGGAMNLGNIHTQFVFRGGEFFCCTTDEPFFITGANDHDVFITNEASGYSAPGISFGGTNVSGTGSWPPLDLDAESRALILANFEPGRTGDWTEFFFYNYFTAIDNDNRISGYSHYPPGDPWLGSYILTPNTPPTGVPEPGTLALLGSALVSLMVFRQKV